MGILTGKSFFQKLMALVLLMFAGASVGYMVGFFLIDPVFNVNIWSDLSILSPESNNPLTGPILKFLQLILIAFIFIIPANIYAKWESDDVGKFFEFNQTKSIHFIFAIAIVFISTPFIAYTIQINEGLHLPSSLASVENYFRDAEDSALKINEIFLSVNTLKGLMFNLLLVALFAAISEELIFRGIIQKMLLQKVKKVHLAIWLTAFIFSAFHMQFFGFIPRLILGALLGYSFYWSNSIWVPILMHFTNNASAVIADYLFRNKHTSIDFNDENFFGNSTIIVSLILSIVVVWFWNKNKTISIT